jgi:transmembrane sensor
MDQDTWKLVLDYLSTKEHGGDRKQEIEDLEDKIQDWVSKDPQRQHELQQAVWLWENTAGMPENEDWKNSFNTIQAAVQVEKPARIRLYTKWSAIAAVIALAAMLIVLYKTEKHVPVERIAWVTKTSGPGKITNITLPDSSEIWLNAGSSITFPENIQRAALRTVKLSGEAFFKVKRDPKHPFIVHSLNIQTRVLGTSFNIRAWKKHAPEVTVLTGKVAVSRDSAGMQSEAIHLLPNQKAVYDSKSSHLYRENIEDAKIATGWTEGKMTFEQVAMEDVFETIERRYGVHIVSDQSFKDCKLTARFNNVSLQEVLNTIQMSLDIRYTINKQTIYIKGGKCN